MLIAYTSAQDGHAKQQIDRDSHDLERLLMTSGVLGLINARASPQRQYFSGADCTAPSLLLSDM